MKEQATNLAYQQQGKVEIPHLTSEETRKVLTPFAFNIDHSLFGITLAAPWRRGLALAIDLLFIALLSDTPGEVLAIVMAITFYRLGNKKRAEQMGQIRGRKKRGLMRLIGALIIFFILADTLPEVIKQISTKEKQAIVPNSNDERGLKGEKITVKESLAFTGLILASRTKMSQSDCDDLICWQDELSPLIQGFSKLNLSENEARDSLGEMLKETGLTVVEQKVLFEKLLTSYQKSKKSVFSTENVASSKNEGSVVQDFELKGKYPQENVIVANQKDAVNKVKRDSNEPVAIYSLMKWTEGIIEDLGLGFGWAAFYFTVFTAVWKGQTPGKKVLGIQVLQLDGTPLSLWDSFGRYGGYGAGIATGLLGFMQIYWDPNRQAIHDKISATIVIDIKKAAQSEKSVINTAV